VTETYRQRDGLREQQMGGDRMLFDDASNSIHVLNGSAAFIWDCIKVPATAEEIEKRLMSEFDVSATTDVRGMILRAIGTLTTKGLIVTLDRDNGERVPVLT
jgi:PqqD family protein of HPr-rel-A system